MYTTELGKTNGEYPEMFFDRLLHWNEDCSITVAEAIADCSIRVIK